jgi:DNA-binding transcriptional ArsR family regulator
VVRIELSDDDLSRTRLALSPLWELVASLFMVRSADPPAEYLPWVARARRALRGVELGPLETFLSQPNRPHTVPDFVAPIPTDPLPTLAEELERVRATDHATVRADVAECWADHPPAPWDAFVARPGESLDRLADGLHAYWEATLADEWPRLRAVLEGEMLGRARALALSGPGAVLDELHPSVRWRRPIVLIPLVFARGVLMGASEEQRAVGLGYQARGTAALWAPEEASADGRIELLLGHGRAAVLRSLQQPATTTELARRLGYAPSTVSAHLDVLSRAGLVDRHRVRRSVFYALNDTGRSLVALLADVPAALTA